YEKHRVSRDSAERMAFSYRSLLENLLRHSNAPLASVQILDDETLRLLTGRWARRPAAYRRDDSIVTRLRAVANQHAERIALVDGEQTWSYRQLLDRALTLAGHLRNRGIGPGQHVGI